MGASTPFKRSYFDNSQVLVIQGDCMKEMQGLPNEKIDSCVTDPPYHIASIVKRFGKTSKADTTKTSERARGRTDSLARLSVNFMGKTWDDGEIAFDPQLWMRVWYLLKPGGHLVAFASRTNYQRMVHAIEQARFEIRDMLGWGYENGFPKSHDQGEGRGTDLKPCFEPIVLARKPIREKTLKANVKLYGTGALNIEACRPADGSWPKNIYTAGKADAVDRVGSLHPSIKPVDLMQWLVRLVTPPGGHVLDPFAGTGTTGEAAWLEKRKAILIERDPDYIKDIDQRLKMVKSPAYLRKYETNRARKPQVGLFKPK